jgi:hypothetical protein
MKAIAYSYWRTIKRGARTYDSIPASVQEDVKALARADVESGEITEEEYQTYIGEAYGEAE